MTNIDDSFYNRQRYVLGEEGMKLLSESSVFLVGLSGLGLEIAKNLVLGGVKEIYLDDRNVCTSEDKSSHFYMTNDDIKSSKSRAEASKKRLSQLNPYVKITIPDFSLIDLKFPIKEPSNMPIFEILEGIGCIVLTKCSLSQIGLLNNFCRSKNIKMISTDVMGLFGVIFCDFGHSFHSATENDEENIEFFIESIENASNPKVRTLNGDKHDLKSGDVVKFRDIDGMNELNECCCTVEVTSRNEFLLDLDTSTFGKYDKNGICIQQNSGSNIEFENFYDQCFKPSVINPDFSNPEDSLTMIYLYLSLKKFHNKYGHYPDYKCSVEIDEVKRNLEKINDKVLQSRKLNDLNWEMVNKLINTCQGELQPIVAIFGGIVAQEAIKAVTNQFTPIKQWFVLEYSILCPDKFGSFEKFDRRYLNLLKCIGQKGFSRLQIGNFFMVGCGAIGCELLKNMAMLGVSTGRQSSDTDALENKELLTVENLSIEQNNCGNQLNSEYHNGNHGNHGDTFGGDSSANSRPSLFGISDTHTSSDIDFDNSLILSAPVPGQQTTQLVDKETNANTLERTQMTVPDERNNRYIRSKLVITDNDLIEKSNLNRQFLFKHHHINQPKSVIARQSVLEINPDMNIEAHQNLVGSNTEHIYSDDFISNTDICINALDNLEGRRYMDSRCITNCCILLDSGTMSTKGHVQVIVPFQTEYYASMNDPEETEIPYCTLKSFPAKIEHCVEWAREKFQTTFNQKPNIVSQYLKQISSDTISENKINYEDLIVTVKFLRNRPQTYHECVQISRKKFETFFNHKARQLIHCFPIDTKLDDGSLFWQFPKRPPNSVEFDLKNPLHSQFVKSYSELLAEMVGISFESVDKETFKQWIVETQVPEFVPSNKPIEIDETVTSKKSNPSNDLIDINEVSAMEMIQSLKDLRDKGNIQISSIEFDKDNMKHVDFMSSLSNLRARMYSIEEVDTFTVKRISGRIIPAIATSTSVVAGLSVMELVKLKCLSDKGKQYEKMDASFCRNSFINLSMAQFIMSQPGEAVQESVVNNDLESIKFTLWHTWTIRGHDKFTLHDFIYQLKTTYKLDANMILQGCMIVYLNILPASKQKLTQTMNSMVFGSDERMEYVDLTVSYANPKNRTDPDAPEDIRGPIVRYFFHSN